ncbi:MAG: DUF6167 family protein [Marmoricola sp.]
MRRGFWFVAGAGAGVYVLIRARRAAEVFTPDGVRDRLAGLQVGAQLFVEEVRSGMDERETELRERLAILDQHRALDGPLELTPTTSGHPYDLPGTHPGTPALEGKH